MCAWEIYKVKKLFLKHIKPKLHSAVCTVPTKYRHKCTCRSTIHLTFYLKLCSRTFCTNSKMAIVLAPILLALVLPLNYTSDYVHRLNCIKASENTVNRNAKRHTQTHIHKHSSVVCVWGTYFANTKTKKVRKLGNNWKICVRMLWICPKSYSFVCILCYANFFSFRSFLVG